MSSPAPDDVHVAHLRSLCAVVDAGSYAAAARRLGLAVPSVWARVRTLESRYETTFFRKRGRQIEPTTDALRLVEAVRPILAALESTFDLVGAGAAEATGTITIVTGMRMALEELAPAMAGFREEFPRVRLRWLHANNVRAQELLIADQADLAVLLNPSREQRHPQVQFEPAYDLEYLAVLPPGHELESSKRIRLVQLVDQPLVVGHADTIVRAALEHAAHQLDMTGRLQPVIETDNSALTIACVRAGTGIGVIGGRPDGLLLRDLAVRRLARELGTASLVVGYRRGTILTPTLRRLVELIRDA